MAFRKIITLYLAVFILASCAQIGTISGGNKDNEAPKPVAGKHTTPSGLTNFKGKSVSLTFNEFIQLNNPKQTLFFVPKHAKPSAKVVKKTVVIDWQEELEENTTYVLYLHNTIKDISEGNDSLMYLVFSTGDKLDSLTYETRVIDAWSNQPLKNITVGLFSHPDSLQPYYFANTTAEGTATFAFLKEGTFFVKAFEDVNKDLRIQPSERIAFRTDTLQLKAATIDSLPLRLYTPKKEKKITSFRYFPPSKLIVKANYPLDKARFFIQSEEIDSAKILPITTDSVAIFHAVSQQSALELIVQTPDKTDTTTLRITEKEKKSTLTLKPTFSKEKVGPHQSITFESNALFAAVDPTKITLVPAKDSAQRLSFQTKIDKNKCTIEFDRIAQDAIKLRFESSALTSVFQEKSNALEIDINLVEEKEFGKLIVNLSKFEGPLLVELVQQSTTIQTQKTTAPNLLHFSNLLPGDYHFRIVRDTNQNGIWDTGDYSIGQQPEDVLLFSTPVKVRANWDIDLELKPY